MLRFIATVVAVLLLEGVDGVELPHDSGVRKSPDEEGDDVIDEDIMEDKDAFILALVRIIDPEPTIDRDMKEAPPPPLALLSSKTLLGRTNLPRLGPHVKYRTPFTDPSFFPAKQVKCVCINTLVYCKYIYIYIYGFQR